MIETGFLISRRLSEPAVQHRSYPAVPPETPRSQRRIQPFSPTSGPFAVPRRSLSGEDWDPFEEMRKMQEEMNRIFDESFGRGSRTRGFFSPAAGFTHTFRLPSFSPAIDLEETEEAYIAKADLPGLEKDKIQVRVSGNVLTIQGERRVESEKEDEERGFYAAERSYGSFARSVTLPGPVDEANVTADYKDGVLTVTLPKLEGAEQEKTIPIQ